MGYEYLREMLAARDEDEDGETTIDPADLPTVLEWEQGVYDVYQQKQTQWHYTMMGRAAFNHEAALAVAARRGYDLDLFEDLMRAIEYAVLKGDSEEREERAAESKSGKSH